MAIYFNFSPEGEAALLERADAAQTAGSDNANKNPVFSFSNGGSGGLWQCTVYVLKCECIDLEVSSLLCFG